MLMPMGVFEWQVLRAVLRSPGKEAVGRSLRLIPSRKTKDGSFLTDIVRAGLIRVVKRNSDPFLATYTLTPLGEYAAEHGEYECDLAKLREKVATVNAR